MEKILIDNQKVVEVLILPVWDNGGGAVELVSFSSAVTILNAWAGLDVSSRSYATDGANLIIAYAFGANGGPGLRMSKVRRYYNEAGGEVPAYRLTELASAIGPDNLKWGDDL